MPSLRLFVLLVVCTLLAAACRTGWSSELAVSVDDFQQTTWTAKEGAPANTWAIAQTDDGWLWFAGPDGLMRFDGIRFERVDFVSRESKLSNGIGQLTSLPSGELLIGHLDGGVTVLKNGKFTHFDTEHTRSAGSIVDFARDIEGAIWATSANGLLRFNGRVWQLVGSEWNYPGGLSRGVLCDADGTLWVSASKAILRLTRGSHRFESVHSVSAWGLLQSPDGKIWYSMNPAGTKLLPGQGETVSPRVPLESSRKSNAVFDNDGNFWGALENTPYKPPKWVRGLDDTFLTALEDRDGNVWMAKQTASVSRLRRPAIVKLSAASGSADGLFPWTSFAIDGRGVVWMARTNGGGVHPVDGVWKVDGVLQRVQGDDIKSATAITRDARGKIWIGGRQGIWGLEGERFVKAIDLPASARGEYVTGLSVNCSGGLWVSGRGIGLLRFTDGAWQRNGNLERLPAATPLAQTCDSSGRLWLGYADGTVARVENDQTTLFSQVGASPVGGVATISVGKHTLVGGERGLALLRKGRFSALEAHIPAFEGVTGIVEASDGGIWLNSTKGVSHIEAAEIDRIAGSQAHDVAVELFDSGDGFPAPSFTLATPLTTIAQAPDGRIWLATHGGIAWIDPSRVRRKVAPSPLVITSLSAAGRPHEVIRGLNLPKGTRSLQVDYTALNYSHPERLRFRYRLDGADEAWVEADTRRQAFYSNLGPGTYRFLVNVTNDNGAWTDSSASLDFVIPPTFIQSRVFLVMCVAVALAVMLLMYRMRVRQLMAGERRRLADLLGERERIARELHDTLLQGTQALILQFQAAANEMPQGSPTRARLGKVLDNAEAVLTEGRDRVLDLRVSADTLRDLPDALAAVGEELAQSGTVTFSAVVEGRPRALVRLVRDEAYSISREALLNAFRHARADSIELQLFYSDKSLRVRVRDDGLGIEQDALARGSRPGHWGLPGMRERAHQIGAQLDIWSRSGAGTEIELTVPAAAAYGSGAPSSRWLSILRFSAAK